MASIFLSYAREDAARAQALAKALERSGHQVWWDRHIHGGTDFSGEIEAALKRSDVVLVLWSPAALRSAWVRDEAAEGRDSGRLVPLLLEDTLPPLGFRQIQSISIAGWSGRGNPPDHQAILAAIAARAGSERAAVPKQPAPFQTRPSRNALLAFAGAAALLIAALAAWLFVDRRAARAETPVLAVLPFADLSPARDKAYFTEGVAEAILTILAREPGIKVIGRSSAEQLSEARGDPEKVRKALGVTHVVEGSARSVGDQLRMSVRLIDASDGSQLWAEEYHRRLDNIFALQDEIGAAVAKRLRGSFTASGASQQLTASDTYALYLAARSRMRDRKLGSLKQALDLAKRVITTDPRYAPGHAVYAEIIWLLGEDSYGSIPRERARRLAEPHARRAIQLAPSAAEGYAALGLILAGEESAVAPLRKASQLDPARADVRNWLGQSLNNLGRHEEALEQFRAVVEMEPLWAPGTSILAYTLAASERYDEALAVVDDYERRGGSPATANKIRGDIANYRGDFSEALRLQLLALRQDPQTPLADMSAAWSYHILGFPERTRALSKNLPVFTRLYMAYDYDGLAAEVRKAGPAIWELSDSRMAIEGLAHQRDWSAIEALLDSHPKGIGDLCARRSRSSFMLHLATALGKSGRHAESRRLVDCHKAAVALEARDRIRSAYFSVNQVDLDWAQIHAFEGRQDRAFDHLERAIARGYRTPVGRGLWEFPVFDPYRASPRYAAADAKLKRLIAMERNEALRALPR